MMSSVRVRTVCAAALMLAAVSEASARQADSGRSVYDRYTESIQLYATGLGTFTRPISSTNTEAQAFFDQGFRLMYAFGKAEAVRSFREAWKRDPDCAICYWGEAWAWGSYLNGPMTVDEAPHAYAAIRKAIALKKDHASQVERDFIDAMTVRYVEKFDPDRRVDQDRAYADAMKRLSDKYPDDLDAATLYADALFLLEPRRGTRDINSPNVQRLHHVLESVLSKDVRHPGACHLYVHATESTVVPERAAACADFLGASMPAASHLNHMPSHTWNRIGRWGDSVRANLEAWHSDLKAASGEGVAIYPEHNLHMLLYAASYDGQAAIAMRAGRDYTKRSGDSIYEVLTLLRFGRFDEVLEATNRPTAEISAGMWDFARGYAHLKQGEPDFAKPYLARVAKAAETSTAKFRGHPASNLLGAVAGILDGAIKQAAGDVSGAIEAFQRAVEKEDALDYDEPEPLPFTARHWLGAALLDAKRFEEADAVYREDLKEHPNNGWTLFGLRAALEGQGKPTADVEAAFAKSWARSDTWIRASRF